MPFYHRVCSMISSSSMVEGITPKAQGCHAATTTLLPPTPLHTFLAIALALLYWSTMGDKHAFLSSCLLRIYILVVRDNASHHLFPPIRDTTPAGSTSNENTLLTLHLDRRRSVYARHDLMVMYQIYDSTYARHPKPLRHCPFCVCMKHKFARAFVKPLDIAQCARPEATFCAVLPSDLSRTPFQDNMRSYKSLYGVRQSDVRPCAPMQGAWNLARTSPGPLQATSRSDDRCAHNHALPQTRRRTTHH